MDRGQIIVSPITQSAGYLFVADFTLVGVHEPPFLNGYLRTSRSKKLGQEAVCLPMIHFAASLKCNGSEIVFRPGVNRKVGLGNGHGPAHTPGLKSMKGHCDYLGSHELCSRQHPLFDHLGIEELLMFALIEIYEHKVK